METSNRLCVVSAKKGQVMVKISTGKKLALGADFRLNDERGAEKETWKINVNDDAFKMYTIKTSPQLLNKNKLTWQILCCAIDPKIFGGEIILEIYQNNQPCHLTSPAKWLPNNVAPCAVNIPTRIAGTLSFILKPD
ncbi:MAG: hypothetical protein NT007_18790 [Candidatus Kapabacteria bacterium]|nr:hypothetical protein [Candidatus Kapabacteria bacterium]